GNHCEPAEGGRDRSVRKRHRPGTWTGRKTVSILVTGCNSTLGYHLLNLLPHDGGGIVALAAEPVPEHLRLDHVTYITSDLSDYKDVSTLVGTWKPVEVYHLVSQEFSLGMPGMKPSALLQFFTTGLYHVL